MKIYAAYENYGSGRHSVHKLYMNKYDAEAHVKQLRKWAMLSGDNLPKNFSVVEYDVEDYYDSSSVVGSGFNPKYVHIVVEPLSGRSDFDGFVTAYHDKESVERTMVRIYSTYNMWTRSWNIKPEVDFYIPYVPLPYEQMVSKARKAGTKMLQRIVNTIDFSKYFGMTPWDLYKAGWELPKATYDRWSKLDRMVSSYYKTDTNKPDKIDAFYMYKCCPGVFNGSPDTVLTWKDYAYKTLEGIQNESKCV